MNDADRPCIPIFDCIKDTSVSTELGPVPTTSGPCTACLGVARTHEYVPRHVVDLEREQEVEACARVCQDVAIAAPTEGARSHWNGQCAAVIANECRKRIRGRIDRDYSEHDQPPGLWEIEQHPGGWLARHKQASLTHAVVGSLTVGSTGVECNPKPSIPIMGDMWGAWRLRYDYAWRPVTGTLHSAPWPVVGSMPECKCPDWWFPEDRREKLRRMPHGEGLAHHKDCPKRPSS